jgi:hypothetical protein
MSPSVAPIDSDIGVIALVPDNWSSGVWMPRHQVLTRLANYFHVLWVDKPHEWRDVPRRMRNWRRRKTDGRAPENFLVYTPQWWLPEIYHPSRVARCTFKYRLQQAKKLLVERGCTKIVLYLWRPHFDSALDLLDADVSCYHVDDEYAYFYPEINNLDDRERRLIERVDQVFLHSPSLMERKGGVNSSSLFIPNGVDYDAFARPASEPSDLAGIPRPRIGYSGVLKNQLDWRLIRELVARNPQWNFVFVGGMAGQTEIHSIVDDVGRHANAHFLGHKTLDELVAYPQYFDVCIMPYRVDGYTNSIYPLKLHEYLATGRPTVGTPIRSLLDFDVVVTLASSVDEWCSAIANSLLPAALAPDLRKTRKDLAKTHDWNVLVRSIADAIALRLDLGGCPVARQCAIHSDANTAFVER